MLAASTLLTTVMLLTASCASQPKSGSTGSGGAAPKESGLYPKFVNEVVGKNAPEDVLVGIGNAKLASLSQSRTVAQSRARAEISRQMDTITKTMVRDYQASSEVDPDAALADQENIEIQLSKSQLVGSRVVVEDRDADGQIWCVVYLDKTGVANEIGQAAAAAKLAVPKAASIDAEKRMDEAFEQIAAEEAAKY
jgi:hypothetical protein